MGYDFEDASELGNITHYGLHSISIKPHVRKHGNNALEWKWRGNDRLLVDLTSQMAQHPNPHKLCGVHFWIHQR